MPRIQIAFQGGGAKLCDLVAAAAAIQKLEEDGKIEVTRVAGTSAGAITACWYATRKPFSFIKQRLVDNGSDYLRRVVPARSKGRAFWSVLRGQPIYDEREFRKVLWEWFKIDGQQFQKFSDLSIPVIVTAADVLNGSKCTFQNPDVHIVDALADSAGLPFVFRAARSTSRLVDGGICENLPAEELLRDEADFGKVIGISFARNHVPQMPTNPFRYALALLDTAMGNSMDRACNRIGSEAVCRISTEIKTFDFEKALTDGLGQDHYDRVRGDVKNWISDFIKEPDEGTIDEGTIFVPPPELQISSEELMSKINNIYLRAYHDKKIVINRSSLIVTANCLLPGHDERSRLMDGAKQVIQLSPVDKPVECFRIGMLSGGGSPVEGTLSFSVRTAQRSKVDTTVVPISDGDIGQRQLLFFFHPALSVDDKDKQPYVVTVQDRVRGALLDVVSADGDHISLRSDRSENIETVDLVVFLPEGFKKVVLSDLKVEEGDGDRDRDSVSGRAMSDAELAEYGDPPPGFLAVGWRGHNLKKNQTFGVNLRLHKPN